MAAATAVPWPRRSTKSSDRAPSASKPTPPATRARCGCGTCTPLSMTAMRTPRPEPARSARRSRVIGIPSRALLPGAQDVLVDVLRQHVERHVAAPHDRVVERLHVEPRAERLLRLVALAVDLAVPHLVAARLARPRAIAIVFARHLQRVRAVLVDEELHALLARPALGVE